MSERRMGELSATPASRSSLVTAPSISTASSTLCAAMISSVAPGRKRSTPRPTKKSSLAGSSTGCSFRSLRRCLLRSSHEAGHLSASDAGLRLRLGRDAAAPGRQRVPLPHDRVHDLRRQDQPLDAVLVDELQDHVIALLVAYRLDDEG